ncbi:MAG: hypothetical protein JSV13_00690 [Nitrospiraceae bacterium]|nr:MAG: hypothetical protein JSV13_00690 [Nitrospiraceae bacterium]
MKKEIEPVYWPVKLAPEKHLELFPDMGWVVWRKPQSQTEYYDNAPWEVLKKLLHIVSFYLFRSKRKNEDRDSAALLLTFS